MSVVGFSKTFINRYDQNNEVVYFNKLKGIFSRNVLNFLYITYGDIYIHLYIYNIYNSLCFIVENRSLKVHM